VYQAEVEAELAASQEAMAAAATGIEEYRVMRSTLWSDLVAATEAVVADPDNTAARSGVARAAGRLSRHERALAELVCAYRWNAKRIDRRAGI
jgi:hypothetical protein